MQRPGAGWVLVGPEWRGGRIKGGGFPPEPKETLLGLGEE